MCVVPNVIHDQVAENWLKLAKIMTMSKQTLKEEHDPRRIATYLIEVIRTRFCRAPWIMLNAT